jgi:hypothetical protein
MNAPDNASSQAAKQFTADQFRWLRQVASDRELPPSAARVAIALTQYLNHKTGRAWPAQETLAATLGLTSRAVRASLAAMARQGHITTDGHCNGGRHRHNVYRMALKPMATEAQQPKPGTPVPSFGATVAPSWRQAAETRNASARNPENSGPKFGTPVPPNPYRTPNELLRADSIFEKGRKKDSAQEGGNEIIFEFDFPDRETETGERKKEAIREELSRQGPDLSSIQQMLDQAYIKERMQGAARQAPLFRTPARPKFAATFDHLGKNIMPYRLRTGNAEYFVPRRAVNG